MKKLNTLHLYCPDDVRDKLRQIAEADHRSMSAEVQALIEQAYDAYVQKTKDNLKR